jgi:SWIM zinc finger.
LTQHIYERLKIAASRRYYITEIHPGIFSVQGSETPDDNIHTISFGDSNSYPSCDCEDWQRFKLPCIHLGAVFNTYQDWTYDMMGVPYRSNPIFNVDWSVVSQDFRTETPGLLTDVGTQTTGANLITNYTPEFSMVKINDPRRAAETPQVLANQCRGLLQQLSKLQLAHHSRDSLYRLRSELKELISIFSSTPKTKVLFPMVTMPLAGKSRKSISNPGVQSIFEQYGVKLISPKQVTAAAETKLSTSHNNEPETASDDSDDNDVDGMYISTGVDDQIVDGNNQNITISTTATTIDQQVLSSTTSRKRTQQSSSPYLKHPVDKKARPEDELVAASQSISESSSVLASAQEPEQFSSNATLSTMINGQTINIPLDQVAVTVDATTKTLKDNEEILTFTSNADVSVSVDDTKQDTSIK